MAVTTEERATFGWLGQIPPEIIDGSREVVADYKRLAQDAKAVATGKMSKEAKIYKAKRIEDRYYALLERARAEAHRRKEKRR